MGNFGHVTQGKSTPHHIMHVWMPVVLQMITQTYHTMANMHDMMADDYHSMPAGTSAIMQVLAVWMGCDGAAGP
jgi:hypothetical protein